jgi:hypothetical protein
MTENFDKDRLEQWRQNVLPVKSAERLKSLANSAGSDPRRDKPRFTTFEIAEYVCGWLLDGQCLHTVEDAEMAISNALGQLRCGQDGLLASKQGRSRNFLSQNKLNT